MIRSALYETGSAVGLVLSRPAYRLLALFEPFFRMLGDATLNAMCAVDALGVGAMFARDCEIESSCRLCAAPIRVTTAGNGERLKSFEPETAMVWNGIYYEGQAATSLCTVIAFFCSPAHSEKWLEGRENSNGYPLTIGEAMEVGKALFRPVLAEN